MLYKFVIRRTNSKSSFQVRCSLLAQQGEACTLITFIKQYVRNMRTSTQKSLFSR